MDGYLELGSGDTSCISANLWCVPDYDGKQEVITVGKRIHLGMNGWQAGLNEKVSLILKWWNELRFSRDAVPGHNRTTE